MAAPMRFFLKGGCMLARGLQKTPWTSLQRSTEVHTQLDALTKQFSTLQVSTAGNLTNSLNSHIIQRNLLNVPTLSTVPVRTHIKISTRKGRPKTVQPVIRRFFRLHWGVWIRTRCGKNKKKWKKSPSRKQRLAQHVFCNKTQNKLLDRMVTKFWREKKYYVDDPYEPYHNRTNFTRYFPEKRPPFYP